MLKSSQAFSPGNPSGAEVNVLSRSGWFTHGGAIAAVVSILYLSLLALPDNSAVGDPSDTTIWADRLFLEDLFWPLLFPIGIPWLILYSFSREFFLLSEDKFERAVGRKRWTVPGDEVTSVDLKKGAPWVELVAPSATIALNKSIRGWEGVYATAVRRLPHELRGSEGYLLLSTESTANRSLRADVLDAGRLH